MEKIELAKKIKAVSYLTGQFRLRSGTTSSFYWDKYRFESDPALLSAIVDELQKLLPPTFDKLAGLELGGIPLATALSLKTGKPCLFVRKTPKPYGTCNLVEGGFQPGDRAVVVEDVVATAGQMYRAIRQMRDLGLVVEHAVCVVDRESSSQSFQSMGCSLTTVLTMGELDRLVQESA